MGRRRVSKSRSSREKIRRANLESETDSCGDLIVGKRGVYLITTSRKTTSFRLLEWDLIMKQLQS